MSYPLGVLEVMTVSPELWTLAAAQHGAVSFDDLARWSISRSQRETLRAQGLLVPSGRRTFVIGGAPRTDRQRVMIACLDAGGVATRGTAAWLHGIGRFLPGDPPEIVARESARDYRAPASDVHSSTNLGPPDVVVVDGIPSLSVSRMLFSLAAAVPSVSFRTVAAAVDEAVRDGKASDPWLRADLERIRCRGRNGVKVFERILDSREDAPTESWLEREFLRLLDRAGVPRPRAQARIERNGTFAARVDFLFEEVGLVVEVSGRVGHSSVDERAADARRRNDLVAVGLRCIEFTYEQVTSEPAYVLDELRPHLARGAA